MDHSKGKRLGQGRTAEIYAWGEQQVLKLYLDWCPRNWIEEEFQTSRAAQSAGLPVPAVGEIVELDGRIGIIFERIEGPLMIDQLKAKFWQASKFARQLADLQAAIHGCATPALPSQRQRLEYTIRSVKNLPEDLRAAVLESLHRLPDGDSLCHGDLHPENILFSERGPVILDWMTAARGNPLADVARTSLILRLGESPPGMLTRQIVDLIRRRFHAAYIHRYMELRQVSRHDIQAWELPVAAGRMCEDIPNERAQLRAIVEAGVQRFQAQRGT